MTETMTDKVILRGKRLITAMIQEAESDKRPRLVQRLQELEALLDMVQKNIKD